MERIVTVKVKVTISEAHLAELAEDPTYLTPEGEVAMGLVIYETLRDALNDPAGEVEFVEIVS